MDLIPGHVPAPIPQPRTKGALLTAAMPGSTSEGVDWHKGVLQWPESAPSWRVLMDCNDAAVAAYGDEAEFGPVAARPFVIQTVTHCPRGSISEMAARAERNLRAVTSAALAHELWTGELTALDPWSLPTGQSTLANQRPDTGTAQEGPYLNPHLTGTGVTLAPTTAPDLQEAIGLVEAAVADRVAGGPIYLHVPSTHLLSLLALQHEGDLLRTPLGSMVVADAGYPPDVTDATQADLTVYGTGPVQLWLDDPIVYDRDTWVVHADNNTVAVWAERAAMLMFDPQTLVGCTVTG